MSEAQIQGKFIKIFNQLKYFGLLKNPKAKLIMQYNNAFGDDKKTGLIRGANAKRMGRVKGTPDLLLIYGNKRVWIELKTPVKFKQKNNGLTTEQVQFMQDEVEEGIDCFVTCCSSTIYTILYDLGLMSNDLSTGDQRSKMVKFKGINELILSRNVDKDGEIPF